MTLLLIFSTACGLRKTATSITADIAKRGMVAVESEEDLFVARESVLPLISMLEVFHEGDPHNKKFLGLLAKSNGNYAFGFAEIEALKGGVGAAEWSARTKRFYAKGMRYGVEALSSGKKRLNDMTNSEFESAVRKMGKKDVETIFWTAFDWGQYINMSRDDISVAADLPRVQQMVDRILVLDPDFMCGVVYAFKGALFAGNPLMNGGKPEAARADFETATGKCGGNFLMNKVMYAEWFLKAINDNAGYEKTLEEVVQADPSLLPKLRLSNEIAKERAEILLKKGKVKSKKEGLI